MYAINFPIYIDLLNLLVGTPNNVMDRSLEHNVEKQSQKFHEMFYQIVYFGDTTHKNKQVTE